MTKKKEITLLACIFILGVFFRFYNIQETPPGLFPDEAMNGGNALDALRTGDFKVFYQDNNGREGLFINIQALSVHTLGTTPWALRIVSAFFGSLTILGIYFLTKELFYAAPLFLRQKISSSGIALFASFFLATSYWHINFSRIGFRAIMLPFFLSFGFYWLLKALRTQKISSIVLAGIFIGLGFDTYIAFRFVPFIILCVIAPYAWRWFKRKEFGCVPCTTLLFAFITFITALPIGWYFLQNPADFVGRSKEVSIFSSESPMGQFALSTIRTLGMFNIRGDCNIRHNFRCQPELFLPVGILFLLGIYLLVRRERNKDSIPSPGWFLWSTSFFMMLPATLTYEGIPHALRSIGLLIPAMIFAGLGTTWLIGKTKNYLNEKISNPEFKDYIPQLQRLQRERLIFITFGIIAIPLFTFNTYFFRFAPSADAYLGFTADVAHLGEYLKHQPTDLKKYVVTDPHTYGIPLSVEPIIYMTNTTTLENQKERNLFYVEEKTIDTIPKDEHIIIALTAGNKNTISLIKKRFPNAEASAPGDFLIFEIK